MNLSLRLDDYPRSGAVAAFDATKYNNWTALAACPCISGTFLGYYRAHKEAGVNVLYFDGSVKWCDKAKWTPQGVWGNNTQDVYLNDQTSLWFVLMSSPPNTIAPGILDQNY